MRALAGSSSHGVFRSKPSSSPSALEQPGEVVGDVRAGPRADGALAEGRAAGRGSTSSGSTSMRVPRPWHSGQAPNGELNENDRGSSSSVSIGCSLGQAICSENFSSRPGSLAGRSTKSKTTSPPASPSAVSTESVSRRLDGRLDREPVDDDLDGVLLLLVELGRLGRAGRSRRRPGPGRSPGSGAGGTGRRTRPCGRGSPARAPGSGCPPRASSTRSTICCGVCREIGAPQVGQCGRPARA